MVTTLAVIASTGPSITLTLSNVGVKLISGVTSGVVSCTGTAVDSVTVISTVGMAVGAIKVADGTMMVALGSVTGTVVGVTIICGWLSSSTETPITTTKTAAIAAITGTLIGVERPRRGGLFSMGSASMPSRMRARMVSKTSGERSDWGAFPSRLMSSCSCG